MKELLRFVNDEKKLDETFKPKGNNKGLIYNTLKYKELLKAKI